MNHQGHDEQDLSEQMDPSALSEDQSAIDDQPSTGPRRARNGKIARLPGEIRELVNQMIFDADFYRDIIIRLNELGYPGIRLQNLSEWRKGGFQDWLRSRRDVEDLKLDRAALLDVANN